jgi:serine/threonine-protein kinase RsbW
MSPEAGAGTPDQSSQLTDAFELRLRGEAAAIAAAADRISDKLEQLQVPEEKRMEILLALQEALANAVVHGCGNDPSQEVRCRLEQYATGHILIAVRDPGPGYLPQQLPDPTGANHIHRDHGRGIYLIRQLMDDVSFEHNGSEIRMWKY